MEKTRAKREVKTVTVICKECKKEFEAKCKNTRYCNDCRPKVKAKQSKLSLERENPRQYESTKDVSYRFSVDHMLDIQSMIKKVKKNVLDIEAIYIKYKNRYKKEILAKYIARIMEG